MNIVKFAKRFAQDEAGLVTVEWVSIAAAVVVGGIAIAYLVLGGLNPVATQISSTLNGVPGTAPDCPATLCP